MAKAKDPCLYIEERTPHSRLRMLPGDRDVIRIDTVQKLPNVWRRFCYWALLGWKWEKL